MMDGHHPSGTAPIKREYLTSLNPRAVPDDDAAEGRTSGGGPRTEAVSLAESSSINAVGGPSRNKLTKEQKKAQRGANKGRRFGKVRDELDLCWKVAIEQTCEFGDECRLGHDFSAYLAAKPKDISYFPAAELTNSLPFVQNPSEIMTLDQDDVYPSLDLTTTCPVFAETGQCRYGLRCRFLGGHTRKDENGQLILLKNEEKKASAALSAKELNFVGQDTLKLLRSKKYPRPVTDAYLLELKNMGDGNEGEDDYIGQQSTSVDENGPSVVDRIVQRTACNSSQVDTPDVAVRFLEKKRLDWAGKTYLAPLTTVGNLPFRRLCVEYGADITCGEMGLATSFLGGSKEEWSLVRRHSSESIFGVQLAGNKPATLVPTAEVIAKECAGNIDFVDLNCGCPIDLVFRAGSGSALLDTPGKLGRILIGMNKALGEIPVTVKLRAGVKDGRNTAHKLMPRLSAEWQAGCITLHGRTRQQRYTRLADWDYIKQCVDAVRAREADEDLPRVPLFGGGDCFSSQDYWSAIEMSGVDGVMVGRGALIKPWIFTEIKERREWDISSRERLELIRKYAEFGLNHFGSDTVGVNTTRRYLCEALSFQCRYVPIGLLEVLPGRINDRAPAFRGRDELETLLSSADSRDWVKISEMFLGPAHKLWTFTPKHKSNAYGREESQG